MQLRLHWPRCEARKNPAARTKVPQCWLPIDSSFSLLLPFVRRTAHNLLLLRNAAGEVCCMKNQAGRGFRTKMACKDLHTSDPIRELLERSKTIAVVGLSDSPMRPSHGVSAYMQAQGYRIIPVNPNIIEALGEKAYASLMEVPEKIDIVDIFRRSQFVEEVVDQAIQLKVPVIWMQEGVIN